MGTKLNFDEYYSEIFGRGAGNIRYKQNGKYFTADGSPVEKETATPSSTSSEAAPVKKKKVLRKKSSSSGDGLL